MVTRESPHILAQSARWIVLSKPAGWHTLHNPRDPQETSGPTIETWLREAHPECAALPEAALLHRLDFETTGCLAAARSAAALAALRPAFRGPEADASKVYLALVAGRPADGSFDLYFTSRHRGSHKATVSPQGDPATLGRCRWRVCSRPDKQCTLLEVRILGPGKRHQIRAGLAYGGYPLLGDSLYGGPNWQAGIALHSWRLRIDSQWVVCPLPALWGVPTPST